MATCRFCKSEISLDATRCPHCTSFLSPEGAQESREQVTYIVDRGIITFYKIAVPTFGIFLTVALSFYFLDVNRMTQAVHDTQIRVGETSTKVNETYTKVNETYLKSQRLDNDMKQVEAQLGAHTKEINKHVAAAQKSAQDARISLEHIQADERESQSIVGGERSRASSGAASDPIQLEHLIETKILATLKNALPSDQYAKLEKGIDVKKTAGIRRRIYSAENSMTLPGSLTRSEGDSTVENRVVNETYDALQVIHDFFKEVFGREIADDAGGALVVTVQYGKDYNNAFWSGQQLVLGDGDGKFFKKGAFYSASVMAGEFSHAVIQKTSGLIYLGQSGGINSSFSDVISVLIDQWQKKQAADKAGWLVMPGALGPAAKANALRSLKEPGASFTKQISTIDEYRDGADVHVTSGIPNKAFYEFAMRLRGNAWEKPARVWYEAVVGLKKDSTFQDFADATFAVAKNRYGEQSPESKAVTQSWAVVGITTPK